MSQHSPRPTSGEASSPSISRPFQLPTTRGILRGVVQYPAGAVRQRPTVVICHGFKGFMEWGFFPPLAELLVQRGMTVVRFNFIGSGMAPGDELVTDLDAFRHATFSGDVDDLRALLEALHGGKLGGDVVQADRLALVGHSRGGGVALLVASEPVWQGRLRALVTWAAVATFERFPVALHAAWRREGEWVIENGRTGQKLPIGVEVLDDLLAKSRDLDLAAAAARRTVPWLIVHGSDDPTVPLAEGQAHQELGADPRELEIIAGADHTFGAKHPFAGPTPALIRVFNATQTWLRRYLAE